MEANKAPEKIYLCPSELAGIDYEEEWLDRPFGDSIEYTRTDAFMEKAVEFMKNANLYLYHCISEECDYVDTDKFIDDFKNYMKGE